MPPTIARTCCLLTGIVFPMVFAATARGQVTALMSDAPGSSVELTVTMGGFTDFDFLKGEATETVAVDSASALVTLFPDDPPYTFCQVHALCILLEPAHFQFEFAGGLIVFEITIADFTIDAPQAFSGVIDLDGDVTFDVAPVRVSGTAVLVNMDNFPMNIAQPFEEQLPLDGRMTGSPGETVVLDQLATPPVEVEIDPATLPDGIKFFELVIALNAGGLSLSGAPVPALLGDFDADADVDLHDFSAFDACITGQAPIEDPPCMLFDFDGDNDVDLIDWSAFQSAFTVG